MRDVTPTSGPNAVDWLAFVDEDTVKFILCLLIGDAIGVALVLIAALIFAYWDEGKRLSE